MSLSLLHNESSFTLRTLSTAGFANGRLRVRKNVASCFAGSEVAAMGGGGEVGARAVREMAGTRGGVVVSGDGGGLGWGGLIERGGSEGWGW